MMNSSTEKAELDNKHGTPVTAPETLPEKVEASIRGEDQPMGREHPRAPGALVLLSYPLALVAILIVGIVVIMVFW